MPQMSEQNLIIKGISELLHRHDYVVVPGFGGFVTQIHFSKFLVDKSIIVPPGKVVSFNKQLKQSDGLLANWLQTESGISFGEANKKVQEFSDYCLEILKIKKRLAFDPIGFFYLDLENNLCFEPTLDENYLPESFGLSAISLQEFEIVKENENLDRIDRRVETSRPTNKKSKFLRTAAYTLLGASVLFFTVTALVNLKQINGPVFSGLSIGSEKALYKTIDYPQLMLADMNDKEPKLVANSDGYAFLMIEGTKIGVADNVVSNVNSHISKSASAKNKKGNFQIVFGCFSMKGNAKRMIKILKSSNITASINGLNPSGLHIVSKAGFDTKEDAQTFLESIKSEQPKAWIMSNE